MQPPSGQPQGQYNQGPQQYSNGPQQYGTPPGGPQYGMQQYPYYPPPKKGMPGWAIALIIGGVALFILPIFALAAIPLITSNTGEARQAEGEQLLGSARDYLRIEYSRYGNDREAFAAFANYHRNGVFDGTYYRVDPRPTTINNAGFNVQITCSPTPASSGGKQGQMQFAWASGEYRTTWR
ncbi:MAG: hypothetical protein R3E76_16740 [Planctomycetota bacterium]